MPVDGLVVEAGRPAERHLAVVGGGRTDVAPLGIEDDGDAGGLGVGDGGLERRRTGGPVRLVAGGLGLDRSAAPGDGVDDGEVELAEGGGDGCGTVLALEVRGPQRRREQVRPGIESDAGDRARLSDALIESVGRVHEPRRYRRRPLGSGAGSTPPRCPPIPPTVPRVSEVSDVGLDSGFGLLFEASLAPSALLDIDGVVCSVNPALCTSLGRPPADLVGRPLSDLVVPSDRDAADALVAAVARERQPVTFRRMVVTPDGERWLEGSISTFDGGTGDAVMLLQAKDVTSEVVADERLRTSEAISRASLDALEQGVMLTDMLGRVRMVNAAGRQMLGYTEDELTALVYSGQWTTFHEDGSVVPLEERAIRRTTETGEPVDDAIVVWVSKAGTPITLRVATREVLDPDGNRVAVVSALTDVTEQRRDDARRRQLEARFEGAFLHAPEGVAIASDGAIVAANPALREIVGLTDEEILGRSLRDLFVSDDRDRVAAALDDAIERTAPAEVVGAVERPDGSQRTVRGRAVPRSADDGVEVIVHLEDVTDAMATSDRLRKTEARFAALVERSNDIICLLDADGRIVYASPAGARVLGYEHGSTTGLAFGSLVHPDDQVRVAEVFASLLASPGGVESLDVRLHTADGSWRFVEVVAVNRLDDPDVRGIVANVRDVSERAQAASRLRWQAFHDPLTGLPNRALLVDRLGHALARARRDDLRTALLYIDLDRFKVVNDTYGHEFGDQLLIEVGRRLSAAVRGDDTVARLGGDEFVVLAEALGSEAEATLVASRINESLADPIVIGGEDGRHQCLDRRRVRHRPSPRDAPPRRRQRPLPGQGARQGSLRGLRRRAPPPGVAAGRHRAAAAEGARRRRRDHRPLPAGDRPADGHAGVGRGADEDQGP